MVARLSSWWRRLGRPQRLALLVGAMATGARLSLTGKGTMAFVDEYRYVTAMLGLRALGEGHVREFFQAINSMGARPGDGLWRVVPGLGQAALLVAFGLNPNAPPSLQVPQVFNVLIMGLNAVVLYKIYRRFFGAGLALVGVGLYSSLANTNFYLRHLLPYDHALFFFLLALWLWLTQTENASLRRSALIGLLAGFSYAVYPGYFMGPAMLLALSTLAGMVPQPNATFRSAASRLRPVAAQLAALVATLGAFELLAQASDTSYLASSQYIATTVTQGDFGEGFSFIGTYFWQVEGWLGTGLLLLFGAGLGLSLRLRRADGFRPVLLAGLLATSFAAWLGYAAVVCFAHKLVFYGRILHFFVPFVVLGALVTLHRLGRQWQARQGWLWAGSGAVALGHFGAFAGGYRAVEYPGDVAYQHGILDPRQIASRSTTGCEANVLYYRPFGPRIRSQPTSEVPKYELVNFAYLYPLSCYQALGLGKKTVVVSVPYFMKYRPYQFEGHGPAQRALMQNYPHAFQIIETQ